MLGAVRTSETLVNFNVTIRHCIPEDCKHYITFFLYKVMETLAVVYELIHLISYINVYNNTLCMIVCHFGVKSALRTIMKLPHSCNFPSPGRNCITLLSATKFSRFESSIAP
jgi:hypothetical protein